MFNGPFEIYEDYQIVPKPILSESVTKAIEFYVLNFSESILHVWAHEDLFFTTIRQKKTTKESSRKEQCKKSSIGHSPSVLIYLCPKRTS